MWPVSFMMDLSGSIGTGKLAPSDSISISPEYHLGFERGSLWLYTYEMPYRGSIYAMTSTNDPPPVESFWHCGQYGFGHKVSFGHDHISVSSCDLPGIYFRRMWRFDDKPPYTTLKLSLGYPLLANAVLPAVWFFRRRHSGLGNHEDAATPSSTPGAPSLK